MKYNRTQVSSSNRANFSHIRKFALGLKIKKFALPAEAILLEQEEPELTKEEQYNYEIGKFLDELPNFTFTNGETESSIAWTPDWAGLAGKYANVGELEQSPMYQAFTNFVLKNYNDPRVKAYLRKLEDVTTGNGHASILYDTEGNLVSDWLDKYKNLRYDGKYGFYHQGPEGTLPEPLPKPKPKPKPKPEPIPDLYINLKYVSDPLTDPIRVIADAETNLIANNRIYQNNMQKDAPLEMPKDHYTTINDNLAAVEGMNDAMAKNYSFANSQKTSSLDSNFALADSAMNANVAAEKQKADYMTLAYNTSLEALTATKNWNKDNRVDAYNENQKSLKALKNLRLTDTNKYIANNASILNTARDKIWEDVENYNFNERFNLQEFADKANEDWMRRGILPYYLNYRKIASDFGSSNTFKQFAKDVRLGKYKNTILTGLDVTKYNDDKALLDWYNNNENALQFRDEYSPLYNKEVSDLETELSDKLQWYLNEIASMNVGRKAKISGQGFALFDRPLGRFQNRLWSDVHPDMNYDPITHTTYTAQLKSGGKIEDRMIKYLEHNRRLEESRNKEYYNNHVLEHKKLQQDLEMLDKESLYLLRLIFK